MTYRIDDIDVPRGNPFQNDQLERKPVVEFLSDLIGRLDGPFVMALDSTFGTGKSTLVRMLIECLRQKGHRCIYFNAWKVDFATDPLVALVASIDRIELGISDKKQDDKYQEQFQKVKAITAALARSSISNAIKAQTSGVIDLEAILSVVASFESGTNRKRDVVEEFNQESKLFEVFRDELTKVVDLLPNDGTVEQSKNITEPSLVFFVDELDRCRPTFAIQLLERIKHLFDIPRIVFVLSTDKKQIEAIIKSVYGAEIDATEYLRRFFNLEFGIPVTDTQRYISSLITRFDLDPIFHKRNNQQTQYDRKQFVEFLNILAKATGLSLRAIEGCVTRLRIVMDQTPSNDYLDSVLLALLIVLRSNKPEYYDQIINSQVSPEDVVEFLKSLPGDMLSQREINILYAYLSVADPDRERAGKRIGKLKSKEFEDQEAEFILQIIRGISNFERPKISLVEIANKIDLVFRVNLP